MLSAVCALAVLLGVGFGVLGGEDPAPPPVPTASTQVPPSPSAPSTQPPATAPTTTTDAAPVAAEPGTVLAALAQLPVKGRAPQTGYTRDQYGEGWVDTDRNGCDTRNDVLARDLTAEQFRPGTRDCVVTSGVLVDPYSGATILFQRGQGTSEAVQIDHVVALSNSWQTGAQGWDAATRVAFANDPLNLLAVDGTLNAQKRDGDAATWLPPDRGYRCAYVARQVAVKVAYGLWTTQAEHDAMAGILGTCPQEPLPTAG
ncbi:HNH endonuclease family protein [Klenkia sp. PcliD-1-E]|nr:HNH endonuclease family protein [Klenkia sp. PcliD-1-E]